LEFADPYKTERVLVVVRTYPTPARTGVEVSCTAAISEDGKRWLRLFPIPYRFLASDQRFRKYQWIDVAMRKSTKDARPESYRIQEDSIRIVSQELSSANAWSARKDWIVPLKSHCMCCLMRELDEKKHPTLGFFKPKAITKFTIQPDDASWSASQLEILRQKDLFVQGPEVELQKVPYKFVYSFTCDHASCRGHNMSCTDWEMGESWRSWKEKYGDDWKDKFLQRYEKEMIHEKDTHFYVGTIHRHPKNWIIIGLFYPPVDPQASLLGL
jgi:hypothetical protein